MTRNMQASSPAWMVTLSEGFKSCLSSATIDRNHRIELESMPEITRPLTVSNRPFPVHRFAAAAKPRRRQRLRPAHVRLGCCARAQVGIQKTCCGGYYTGVASGDVVRCWRRESGRRERASLSSSAAGRPSLRCSQRGAGTRSNGRLRCFRLSVPRSGAERRFYSRGGRHRRAAHWAVLSGLM